MNFNNQEIQIKEIKNIQLNKTLQIIRKLAKELIEISRIKKEKFPFKEECMDKLIKKMKMNPGKFLIDLEDLPLYFIVKFNNKGNNILRDLLNFIKKKYGLDRINRRYGVNFYLINDSINKREGGLEISTIRKYIKFLSNQKLNIIDINKIKKSIIEIKANIKSKAIRIKGLPIDLRDEKWAPIFGIILDTHLKKFKFVAEDEKFAEDVRYALKNIGIDPYFKKQGNLIKIKGNSIIGHIINIAGIEVNKKQLIANNYLPPWMLLCSKKYHAILLSKFLDTEGYVPKGGAGIRIAQASFIDLTKDEKDFVLLNCKNTIIKPSNKESKVLIFSKLNETLKEKVLSNPSLILLSTQILLRKYEINSKIYPIQIYISSNGIASISWHLAIIGFNEIKKFNDLCSEYISITYKKDNIKKILYKQKINCLPKNTRIYYYLSQSFKFQNKKGYFTSKDLIKEIKRTKKTINNTIGYLASLDLIKTIKINTHLKLWNLTEKGFNILKK